MPRDKRMLLEIIEKCRCGGIGRRAAFRAQFFHRSVGSNPTIGTIFQIYILLKILLQAA